MRKLKIICVTAMLVLFTALLAGCGARVSTTMTVDAANGNFAGSRVMTLLIENEDLSKVTGGMPALETVITQSMPADLSYIVSYPSETQSQITFTLAFTSLDDYKTKVTNLLAADAENTLVPEITFEKNETVFRKGLKFEENFDTVNLLKWYQNAIAAANIITESSSNWYEMGDTVLVVDGTTLDTYGSRYDYDKVDERFLNSCDVRTVMNVNGTYDRTITFEASKSSLEDLTEVNENFAGYMQSIATEGITYATETDPDTERTSYIYTITGVSAEDLVAKTNAIMQTPDNTFAVTITPKEGVAGKAVVSIQESLNGSFYMDADYHSVDSTIVTYPNFRLTDGNASTNYSENELYCYTKGGEAYTLTGDWLVGYEKAELKIKASSPKKMTAQLILKASDSLAAEIRDIAFSALEAACANNAKFSKDGNTATCEFTGNADELADKIDAFVKVYQPPKEDEDVEYGEVFLKELATASKFTKGLYGTLDINLYPVLGNTKLYISTEGGTEIADQLEADETGKFSETDVSLRFYAVNMNFIMLIVAAVFGVLLLGGAAIAVINREGFAIWIAEMKAKSAPAVPAQGYYPQGYDPQQQYYAPQQEQYAQPQQQYYAPQEQYAQPQQQYYAQPQQQYYAPQQEQYYAQPQQEQYYAPAQGQAGDEEEIL